MPGPERLEYVGGGKCVLQVGWIGLYQTVNEINLLQGVVNYFAVYFIREVSIVLWAVLCGCDVARLELLPQR